MASTTTRPSTPVRVPKSAGNYAPSNIDSSLRSEINTLLLQGGHIIKIQDHLLHALNSSPSNWPTLIHAHALALMRSGECQTFPELMGRVMEDVRQDTVRQQQQEQGGGGGGGKTNGNGVKGDEGVSLALPSAVVEEGVRVTRECLEVVCEFQP